MSGKTIWLIMMDNSLPELGPHNRNFWFAKHLKALGYNPVVFAASRERAVPVQMIEDGSPFKVDESHGFPFVYVRIKDYGESMKRRILAILEFHKRFHSCANDFVTLFGKPDVIVGTNGYPLSPWLANRLAKKYEAASICEVCDLWPLSLEEYGIIRPGGFIAKVMYRWERKNYEDADAIIFSMEGGARYLQDKGWTSGQGGKVDLQQVHHINNGIDLEAFEENRRKYSCDLAELQPNGKKKIVYTGSIRKVNGIDFLVDVAALMQNDPVDFVIVGGGDELETVSHKARDLGLTNISFTGPIEKRQIPDALSRADLLLLFSAAQESLSKYGMSQNKLFDYLASGKPILANLPSDFSIVNKFDCGRERDFSRPSDYAQAIREMISDESQMKVWGGNAAKAAELYSFGCHGRHLADIVESISKEEK